MRPRTIWQGFCLLCLGSQNGYIRLPAREAAGCPPRPQNESISPEQPWRGIWRGGWGWEYEILPLQERIEEIGDSGDLQDVYDTERHLLYVACTRARDFLLVSGVVPASEFIEDFR